MTTWNTEPVQPETDLCDNSSHCHSEYDSGMDSESVNDSDTDSDLDKGNVNNMVNKYS